MPLSLFATLTLATPYPLDLTGKAGKPSLQLFPQPLESPLAGENHAGMPEAPVQESTFPFTQSSVSATESALSAEIVTLHFSPPTSARPLKSHLTDLSDDLRGGEPMQTETLMLVALPASSDWGRDVPVTEDLSDDPAALAERLPSLGDATVLGDDDLDDDLTVGVESLLPPPIPLGEARAELLETLGLDTQVVKAVPRSKDLPPWAVTTYAGRFTQDDLGPSLIGNVSGFEDSSVLGVGVSRKLAGRRPLSLEAEGQILQHFGEQGHAEGTLALVLRWHDFPWDDKIDTTFAIGEGISYATSVPVLEVNRNGRSTRLLNYLLFELTFAIPQEPDWQFVGRIHHRSGVYGLFGGVGSGSNLYVAGIRRRF